MRLKCVNKFPIHRLQRFLLPSLSLSLSFIRSSSCTHSFTSCPLFETCSTLCYVTYVHTNIAARIRISILFATSQCFGVLSSSILCFCFRFVLSYSECTHCCWLHNSSLHAIYYYIFLIFTHSLAHAHSHSFASLASVHGIHNQKQ